MHLHTTFAMSLATRSTPVGFADMRRQSYKKLLNFEAYFIKISSIGAPYRGIHDTLFRPYCRKQRKFRYPMVKRLYNHEIHHSGHNKSHKG